MSAPLDPAAVRALADRVGEISSAIRKAGAALWSVSVLATYDDPRRNLWVGMDLVAAEDALSSADRLIRTLEAGEDGELGTWATVAHGRVLRAIGYLRAAAQATNNTGNASVLLQAAEAALLIHDLQRNLMDTWWNWLSYNLAPVALSWAEREL